MEAEYFAGCIFCPEISFVLKKWDIKVWVGFIWLRIGSNGGFLCRSDELTGSMTNQ
jgi:hypothetical protein